MSPVGAVFVPFPPKTRTNLLHPRPPPIVERVVSQIYLFGLAEPTSWLVKGGPHCCIGCAGGEKPPAAVGVRISKGERHDFGALAPLPIRTPFLEQGRAGGPVKLSPKLAELVGPVWTLFGEKLSPCFASTAAAASSVRSRVLVSDGTSASMVRRGCRASCSRPGKRCFVAPISSASSFILSKWLSIHLSCLSNLPSKCRYTSTSVGWSDPNSSCWGMEPSPSETALLYFRGMLE